MGGYICRKLAKINQLIIVDFPILPTNQLQPFSLIWEISKTRNLYQSALIRYENLYFKIHSLQ